jgi:hypothetical protein
MSAQQRQGQRVDENDGCFRSQGMLTLFAAERGRGPGSPEYLRTCSPAGHEHFCFPTFRPDSFGINNILFAITLSTVQSRKYYFDVQRVEVLQQSSYLLSHPPIVFFLSLSLNLTLLFL